MNSEFTKDNAIKVFILDSLESMDMFNLEIRDLKKRFTKGNFKLKVTDRLLFKGDEKFFMEGAPKHIISKFKEDPKCPPIYVTNYFSREVYIHLIDKDNGCICNEDLFKRIVYRYGNDLKEHPTDYSNREEFRLIKKDLDTLITNLTEDCDLNMDELNYIANYFKDSAYRIYSLIRCNS